MVVDETDAILKMLALIDAALVASLVVMVIISGYENFVSRFDNADSEVSFLGKIDAGSLKIKVASTIVAISSIHLLQIFLNIASYTDNQVMWLTIMHMAFVLLCAVSGIHRPRDVDDEKGQGQLELSCPGLRQTALRYHSKSRSVGSA